MKKNILLFCVSFVFVFGVLCMLFAFFALATAPDRYTILFVGSDQRGTERARSDVLFVVSIPKSGQEAPFFLSIPRDTKIEHTEWGLQKINHFYALGERPDDGKILGNIDLTQSVVEELLDTKIDAVIEVTFESFAEVVNLLGGGVLAERTNTGEQFDGVNTAALTGQNVSGEDALVAIRDRHTGGRSDFDRQADERELFRSLMTKVKSPEVVTALLAYFEHSDQARLHYNTAKLVRFGIGAGIARKGEISIGEMEEGSLPGVGGYIYTPSFGKELSYWIVDEAELQVLLEEHFGQ